MLDLHVSVDQWKHQEVLGNVRIPASLSMPDLKRTELRSGRHHKTPEPALEMRNVYGNKVWAPELARNQSEPKAETVFGILLPEIADNPRDSAERR